MLRRRSSVELLVLMTDIWSVYKYYFLKRIQDHYEITPPHAIGAISTPRELPLEPLALNTSLHRYVPLVYAVIRRNILCR